MLYIIYAKIKTQCASVDVLEPVGSPAVIAYAMVSNLPLRVVRSLYINQFKEGLSWTKQVAS